MKIAYNSAYVQTGTFTSPHQSHLWRAAWPPLTQRIHSPASCATNCTSCAMPIADVSNHSATRQIICQLHTMIAPISQEHYNVQLEQRFVTEFLRRLFTW